MSAMSPSSESEQIAMPHNPQTGADEPPELPPEVVAALAEHGIAATDEVSLRRALEQHTPSYSLFRLSPAAVKRWKCRYRVLLEAGYYDGMSAAEAYARALLAMLPAPE